MFGELWKIIKPQNVTTNNVFSQNTSNTKYIRQEIYPATDWSYHNIYPGLQNSITKKIEH